MCNFLWFLSIIPITSYVQGFGMHGEQLIERKERALLFPQSSTIGILAALALPLNDRKDVFLSYNFEANYNSPANAPDYIPGPLTRLDLVRSFTSSANSSALDDEKYTNSTESTEIDRKRRSLITRRNFYIFIEKKLNASGLNGHRCLLRAICEAAEIPLGIHNGVLGDIMHVMFTPTTSVSEEIPSDFYEAELHGTQRLCDQYHKRCSRSLLDMVSTLVDSP